MKSIYDFISIISTVFSYQVLYPAWIFYVLVQDSFDLGRFLNSILKERKLPRFSDYFSKIRF